MNKVNWGYCTHSWNPIAMRCTRVSEGCDNCWHLRMADRLAKNPKIADLEQYAYAGRHDITGPLLHEDVLREPLSRKRPMVIAVQFMGDLWHEDVPFEMVCAVFGVMAATPQHTYLLLTKRPYQAALWFEKIGNHKEQEIARCWAYSLSLGGMKDFNVWPGAHEWPLPNVYCGVTVEDQPAADRRIPILLQIPAAGRWVSMEPMLGPIDIYPAFCGYEPPSFGCGPDIDGIVLGGESGPAARPMNPDWARGVRDDCADSYMPFHFKQWGAWVPFDHWLHDYHGWNKCAWWPPRDAIDGAPDIVRVGAKHSGRLLDGRTHDETVWGMPNA